MTPNPRPSLIRKTIKWGGAAVTVLLAAMWAATGWWWVSLLPTQQHWVSAQSGRISVCDDPMIVPLMAVLPKVTRRDPSAPDRFQWWIAGGNPSGRSSIGIASINPRTRTLAMLLWPLVLLSAGATGVAWRMDSIARQRQRARVCPKCRYDRTGLGAGAKCPECGAVPASV